MKQEKIFKVGVFMTCLGVIIILTDFAIGGIVFHHGPGIPSACGFLTALLGAVCLFGMMIEK